MGLRSMRERTEMLGANLRIDCDPWAGTGVKMRYPSADDSSGLAKGVLSRRSIRG
jgi:nitrate/nitrite-specific signal transduction histidine kinase